MANDIAPPTHVSNDGKEVWDWADRLSRLSQLNHRARVLSEQVRRILNECGSCQLWMTNSCPRERPGTGKQSGYSVGPSCRDAICGEFAIKSYDQKRLESLTEELRNVKDQLGVS